MFLFDARMTKTFPSSDFSATHHSLRTSMCITSTQPTGEYITIRLCRQSTVVWSSLEEGDELPNIQVIVLYCFGLSSTKQHTTWNVAISKKTLPIILSNSCRFLEIALGCKIGHSTHLNLTSKQAPESQGVILMNMCDL